MASNRANRTSGPFSDILQELRSRGQKVGHRVGIHVALHSVRSSASLRRQRMLHTLGVDVLFDVGANEGQYGSLVRSHGYDGLLVSFEPQHGPFQTLQAKALEDRRWEVLSVALGSGAGNTVINVAAATGVSSLLPTVARHLEEDAGARYVDTQPVPLLRLDDAAQPFLNPNSNVGIKLDVQGYEWHVLAGAGELLRRATYVECELLLASYYEGQAPVDGVVALLYDAGLRLAGTDHGRVDEHTGMVTWLDAVFVRYGVPA